MGVGGWGGGGECGIPPLSQHGHKLILEILSQNSTKTAPVSGLILDKKVHKLWMSGL